ncbi:resolvase [Bacillus pseudomycoides]|nr:Transposon Tn1546 resolvase [Bacillus pseudomycoides DSM 12442]OOR49508.1 resolvase [Bacillus pseudomycoides]PDY08997.1 resolvase [Bacillus pseudomycoides]PEU49692.1 resolvase [Bacillus pseudomycoides]PFY12399.1 resolvase [Bacillus pseudomycoides]
MDIIFEEEVSGVTKDCEQLKKMLGDFREYDTIYVTDLTNLLNSYT